MQPSTEPVCVVIKRGEAYPGKQDLDYFTGVSAETAGSKRLCMHLVAIPPRGRAKPHLHAHHESAIYMLSGEAGQRVRPRAAKRSTIGTRWLPAPTLPAQDSPQCSSGSSRTPAHAAPSGHSSSCQKGLPVNANIVLARLAVMSF